MLIFRGFTFCSAKRQEIWTHQVAAIEETFGSGVRGLEGNFYGASSRKYGFVVIVATRRKLRKKFFRGSFGFVNSSTGEA